MARSRDEVSRLLPQGASTPDHALFDLMVLGEPEPVGISWLAIVDDFGDCSGFIYDVWICPGLRGRGLGSQALAEAETWARSQGLGRLSLHVFGHNPEAIDLDRKLGFAITNVNMTKRLD